MTTGTSHLQILLAEDNAADIMLVREALKEQHLDCTLHVISDGAEAIAFLERLDRDPKAHGLDLLLLDMHLPKCDGEDILKRLRSTELNAQTPVIVMTASASPRDRVTAEKHAAMHYFNKPSDLSEFMKLGLLVREILTNKPASTDRKRGSAA
jgi:CheY-like chemotaxis protein